MTRDPSPRQTPPDWNVRLRYYGGLLPWHAFINRGIAILGEPGSTTYSSRTPERALTKAMRTIAKLAPNERPERIVVKVEGWR